MSLAVAGRRQASGSVCASDGVCTASGGLGARIASFRGLRRAGPLCWALPACGSQLGRRRGGGDLAWPKGLNNHLNGPSVLVPLFACAGCGPDIESGAEACANPATEMRSRVLLSVVIYMRIRTSCRGDASTPRSGMGILPSLRRASMAMGDGPWRRGASQPRP